MKRQVDEVKGQAKKELTGLDPLRREVDKLTRENNDLHSELIRIKERADLQELRHETTIRSLQEQKNDLQFLLSKKEKAQLQIQEENESLRIQVEELLSKLYLPSKATGGESAPREYMADVFKNSHNRLGR